MNKLVKAKCQRCLGSAEGTTLEEATNKINHAVGLSRGIPCGNSYNKVVEIKDDYPLPKNPTPKTDKITYHKVEKTSKENIPVDETNATVSDDSIKEKSKTSKLKNETKKYKS